MKQFILSVLLFYLPTLAFAQSEDSTRIVSIVTKKGYNYAGDLVNITEDSLYIKNDSLGLITFGKDQIKRIRDGFLSRHFPHVTNASTPYLIPTAIPLGKGNNYYKNIYLFGNEFNFGLSDHLSLSLGFEIASLIFSWSDIPLFQVGLKAGMPINENVHVGLVGKYLISERCGHIFRHGAIDFWK